MQTKLADLNSRICWQDQDEAHEAVLWECVHTVEAQMLPSPGATGRQARLYEQMRDCLLVWFMDSVRAGFHWKSAQVQEAGTEGIGTENRQLEFSKCEVKID